MSGLQPALCHLAFLSAGQLPYGLPLSLLPERGGPLPAPSFASSEEGRCLASSDGCGWGGNNSGAAGWRILCISLRKCSVPGWRSLHLGLVEEGEGVPSSPCASASTPQWIWPLHHGHVLATGDKWGSVRGGTETVSPPTTPPQTSASHCPKGTDRMHWYLCHSLKGAGCADTWAETTETVLSILFSLLGVTAGQAEIQSFQ